MKLLLLTTLFLISCGKSTELPQVLELNTEESPIIVGSLNWYGMGEVSSKKQKAASPIGVLKIKQKNTRCNAFMISPRVAMTNFHCISNQNEARGATIKFRYYKGSKQATSVKCDRFIRGNESLDYTLLECKGEPGRYVGMVTFSTRKSVKVGEGLMLAHHNCDYYNDIYCSPYLKFSFGKVLKSKVRRREVLFHDADTLPGSSGSPVFYYNKKKKSYYLIAIHNKGYGDGNDDGRGSFNSGILASSILKDIRKSSL